MPKRYLCFYILLALTLFVQCCKQSGQKLKTTEFCSPFGVEVDGSRFRGSNSFSLCKIGESFNTTNWGQVQELWIRCRPGSLRAGWKWHIWCNADGSHCACDRNGIIADPSDITCCAWSAGDHCTANGQARPGQNGCAGW
jgi:hypothetical protein